MTMTGQCKHGEFNLANGCPKCIEEFRQQINKPIIKVRYFSETTGELSAREYTYFTEEPLQVGDIIMVPVRDTTGKAKVSVVDVPSTEIAAFRDKVKSIPVGSKIVPEVVTEQVIELGITKTTTIEPTEEPTETAMIRIGANQDSRVLALYEEGIKLRDYALARQIKSDDDLVPATDDLVIIAKLKKAIEATRKEYVEPIREHLDAVNATFREFTAPLNEADLVNGNKVTAYRTEVARRQLEAEAINQQKLELARREAELSGTGEFTVDTTPVVVPKPVHKVTTNMGSTSTQKIYKWEVSDLALVPREYMIVNAALIGGVVRASKGSISIPGIKIWSEDTIRVNTR